MLARIRKSLDKDENQGGFTLIELLVVMIIIGILAAIAIPAFLSQKNKAKETSAKADVSTIGKEIAAYYVDGTNVLSVTGGPGGNWTMNETTATGTEVAKGKLSAGNSVTGPVTAILSGDSFCVSVKNTTAGTSAWKYSATAGLEKGAC